ncbi:MAG: hypothetical protein R2715_15370 [Ilumatobacteraceae bacterium]
MNHRRLVGTLMLRGLALVALLAPTLVATNVSAGFVGSTDEANVVIAGALTGIHAPGTGTTTTMQSTSTGECTVNWSALTGGTTVASSYRLIDAITGSTLSQPGNVSVGSYSFTPARVVSRVRLATVQGNWISSVAESDAVACVLSEARSVSMGGHNSCAIQANGIMKCWGINEFGLLGVGDEITRVSPTQVGSSTWLSVDTADSHTCAVRADHTMWCWGYGGFYALGTGTNANSFTPVQTGTASDWRQVAAGWLSTCAVKTTGTLWCWGVNAYGGHGTGNTTTHTTPIQSGTASDWKQVAVGMYHTCAVKTTGTLWCWGYNWNGQLGVGNTTNYDTAQQVGTATNWRQVLTALDSTCALNTSGELYCWGFNRDGQLGVGDTTDRTTPTLVPGGPWADADAYETHTCASTASGEMWCWGLDAFDESNPDNDTTDKLSPVRLGTVSTWGLVATGTRGAVRFETTPRCGVGGTTDRVRPASGSPGRAGRFGSWVDPAAQGEVHAWVKADGTLWCWGDGYQEDGNGTLGTAHPHLVEPQTGTDTDWASTDVGAEHSCAVKVGGSLWCWGGYGRLGNGSTATGSTRPRCRRRCARGRRCRTNHTWPHDRRHLVLGTESGRTARSGRQHGPQQSAARRVRIRNCRSATTTPAPSPPEGLAIGRWGLNSEASSATDPRRPGIRRRPSGRGGRGSRPARTTRVGQDDVGTLWCWGRNDVNQLGDGTTTSRMTPTDRHRAQLDRCVGGPRESVRPPDDLAVVPTAGVGTSSARSATAPTPPPGPPPHSPDSPMTPASS